MSRGPVIQTFFLTGAGRDSVSLVLAQKVLIDLFPSREVLLPEPVPATLALFRSSSSV